MVNIYIREPQKYSRMAKNQINTFLSNWTTHLCEFFLKPRRKQLTLKEVQCQIVKKDFVESWNKAFLGKTHKPLSEIFEKPKRRRSRFAKRPHGKVL